MSKHNISQFIFFVKQKSIAVLLGFFLVECSVPTVCLADTLSGKTMKEDNDRYLNTEIAGYEQNINYINGLRSQKKMPEHRLNALEGDLFFKRGRYFDALKYYKRASYDVQVRDSLDFMKQMEYRKILCYEKIEDISRMAQYVERLSELAERTNDLQYMAVVVFFQAKIDYYRGYKELGYKKMNIAVEQMKKCEGDVMYNHLLTFYLSKLQLQQNDMMTKAAQSTLKEIESMLDHLKTGPSFPFFSEDIRMKDYYGYFTVTLHRLGHEQEAKDYFNKYLSLGDVFAHDYSSIEPYLFDRHLYDEVIHFGEIRLERLKALNDTINYNAVAVYRLMAKAYVEKGDYTHAIRCFRTLESLHDKMKRIEELSAMEELSSNYAIYERKLSTMQKGHDDKIRYILMIVIIIVVSVLIFVWQSIRYNRAMKKKNVSLVKTIDELLNAKKKYYNQASMQLLDDSFNGETIDNGEVTEVKQENAERMERSRFESMRRGIIDKKLFLDPNLSRMILLEKYKIPKNTFSHLFQKYAGKSYSTFINDLRLEHAAQLLRDRPNHTVESVAIDCGMSSVGTLYKLFSKKYGMTPTEYRTITKSDCENSEQLEDEDDQ